MDEVFPIERIDAEKAKDILLGSKGLSARDALHVAIRRRYGVTEILSFVTEFDGCPGINRLV